MSAFGPITAIVFIFLDKGRKLFSFFNSTIDSINSTSGACIINGGLGISKNLNIGNNNAVDLLTFISMLEKELGLEAKKEFDSLQKGDVVNTLSDNMIINEWIGSYPKTPLNEGIKIFINWYKNYYK